MLLKPIVITTLIALVLSAAALAQTPYDEGQKALREQRWMAAANHFEEAVDGEQGAAAMYWRAHALYKAGHRGEAARQIRDLEKRHPDSTWVQEAKALQIEHDGSINDAIEEDELRLFALSSLMHRDQQRAVPLVLELMRNTASESVRRDALFLLGVTGNDEANAAIAEMARSSEDPDLQAEAIYLLGGAATESSLALLRELYQDADNVTAREAVIHAHVAAGHSEALVEFLRTETDPSLQRDLIHALGMTGATQELDAIYPTLKTRETRVAALEAMAISGDSRMLRRVLETETDPKLRRTAIEGIAMTGGEGAADFLASAYDQAASREEKIAVLESLAILGGGEAVALEVIRTESDTGLQRRAIEMLGMIGATDQLRPLYRDLQDRSVRKTVLESMMIAGDVEGVQQVLDSEQDSELRVAAIHSLAIMNSDAAASYLIDAYAGAPMAERKAVAESMMIMHNVQGLITLLEQEEDVALRRELLQTLSMMDDEEATEYLFQLLESEG